MTEGDPRKLDPAGASSLDAFERDPHPPDTSVADLPEHLVLPALRAR